MPPRSSGLALEPKILDGVVAGCKMPDDSSKLYSQMLRRLINRSLEVAMDAQLGCEDNENLPLQVKRLTLST